MPLVCWRMSSNISHKAAGQDVVKPRISELRRFTRAFQCLDRFFCTYLESSNIVKLSLKPEACATAYLKEEKWSRVDKRATSMILTSGCGSSRNSGIEIVGHLGCSGKGDALV